MIHPAPTPVRSAWAVAAIPPVLGGTAPAPLHLSPFGTPDGGTEALPQQDVDARLAGRRVLLVEDEVIVALELAMELEDRGAEVIGPAHDLASAVDLAGADGIDAAILDVDLRGEEVYPVAERLMAAGVPFVFHTGHGDRAELRERFDGALVCTKPTLSEELVAVVATLVD